MSRRQERIMRKTTGAPTPARIGHLKVTDHALFRWMERAGVVDVEQLRMALTVALDRAYQAAARINQGELLILSDGLVYVVREGTLVTVLSQDSRHNHGLDLARLRRAGEGVGEGGDVG